MAAIEQRRSANGPGKKLKVGYNKVFGYYIEIPRSVSDDVPGDYIRKQTLSNCERFITQELKELETTLLTAKDRVAALEYELFHRRCGSALPRRSRAFRPHLTRWPSCDVLCSLGGDSG